MKLDELKNEINSAWDSMTESMAEGWHRLRGSAAGALIRFRPGERSELPARAEVDDEGYLPWAGWAMLTGNVFEDASKVVVRLEVPGMEKDNIKIEVRDDTLEISGEKRFEREHSEGRYRSFQCAYGSFRRSVRLPAPVVADAAKASYRDGVLRVELPKEKEAKPNGRTVKID